MQINNKTKQTSGPLKIHTIQTSPFFFEKKKTSNPPIKMRKLHNLQCIPENIR